MATIFKPDEEEQTVGTQVQPGTSGSFSPVQQQSAQQPQQAQQPQGSGRFTNLQQYLDVNQGAGQQLSGRIGQNIQQDLSKQSDKAQDYYSKVREGVQQGQQTAQAGSGYLQQLQGIGSNIQAATGADQYGKPQQFGIQEFVQQPGFSEFQNIQAGRGINENLLTQQQQQLGQTAQGYLGSAQDYLGNLGTESGRFNLLKQTFGGNINPQYTAGQQRLDQMFLTNEGLMPLQDQVRQDVRSAQDLQRQAQMAGTNVQNLIEQERQLIGDIGQTSMSNEQAYLDMLQSHIPAVNEQRGAEWQQLQDALNWYRRPDQNLDLNHPGFGGLSQEQLARLGVTEQMGAYNVLTGLQGAEDIASRGMDATGYQDVAQQADLDRYNALAQIAGLTDQQKRLTGVSQIGDAYTSREGDAALTNRLTAADEEFNRLLDELNYDRSLGGTDYYRTVGSGRNLFETGSDALRSTGAYMTTRPADVYSGINVPSHIQYYGQSLQNQAQGTWNDFEQWLKDQGYAQTIGGQMDSSGYGTRLAPYQDFRDIGQVE